MKKLIYLDDAIEAIYDEFSYVYCHNCDKNGDSDKCEDCHRKYMNWSASKITIERVLNQLAFEAERRTDDER